MKIILELSMFPLCVFAALVFRAIAIKQHSMEVSANGASLLAYRSSTKRGVLMQDHTGDLVRKPTVLYGIESCESKPFNLMVKAQLETWGRNISRDNFVIVGGAYDDYKKQLVQDQMPCDDKQSGLACKEAVLLVRAVERARKLDAQWLVLGQDDKYVWPEEVEKALSKHDANEPKIFSSFGCGQAWPYHKEANHGKKPRPAGWVEPAFSCKAVYENAGICGGPTYIVSRGALEKLFLPDQSAAAFIEEFTSGATSPGGQSDMYASCLFYSRDIPFKNPLGELGRDITVTPGEVEKTGIDKFILDQVKGSSGHAPLTAHIVLPKDSIPTFIRKTASTSPSLLEQDTEAQNMEQSSLALALEKSQLLHALDDKTNEGFFSS